MSQGKQWGGLDARCIGWLEEIGIGSARDLKLIGVRVACEMIRELHPEAPTSLAAVLQRALSARGGDPSK